MLVAVGLVAAFCAWFAVARNRADERDQLIPTRRSLARMKRRGPRWLDPLGVDRFRRRLVGITIAGSNQYAEQRLHRLARLAETRLISLEIDHLTLRIIDALRDMPQLRTLSIDLYYGRDDDGVDQSISDECLAALGTLTQLEHLQLKYLTVAGDGLAALAGLAHLRTLSLYGVSPRAPPLLRRLPMLPQLEAIDIEESEVCDDDLRSLTACRV